MRLHHKFAALIGAIVIGLLSVCTGAVNAAPTDSTTTNLKYGWKDAADYDAKWGAPYGPGEGTRSFDTNTVTVSAAPFTTASDFGVYDHLKYIRVSNQSFTVPESGSLEISVDIEAQTPGTQPGRVVHGCYGPSYSWPDVNAPCAEPWSQSVLEGQQAGVVLNMINFQTGQLFDWFVSGGRVFALIERLPTVVTGSPGVGLDKAYTQIVKEAPVKSKKHTVSIRYTRGSGQSTVDYLLDNEPFAHVDHVGIPLDVQGVQYTGTYPSLGAGEQVSLDSFVIGHGLFSLLDAFPFQHPDRPDLSVSIPLSERMFGQGAVGTWSNFKVTIMTG